MAHIITVSERDEDIAFGQAVAKLRQADFSNVVKASDLRKLLKETPKAFVFWDIDHLDAIEVSHPLSIGKVGEVLNSLVAGERVFVISDQPLNKTPYIFNVPCFCHHLYRQFADPASQIIAYVTNAFDAPKPFEISQYTPPGSSVKKVTLKNTVERRTLVEALHNVLQKMGLPVQLEGLVTQTTDELLMNAIFDAPCADGNYFRRQVPRNSEYELLERERPDLNLCSTDKYMVISVVDHFGSLKRDSVLNFIRRDYETQEYKVRENDPGAGLGVYGVLQSGLSLVFISREYEATEVMLFVPVVKNMKTFRKSFRFFSFI